MVGRGTKKHRLFIELKLAGFSKEQVKPLFLECQAKAPAKVPVSFEMWNWDRDMNVMRKYEHDIIDNINQAESLVIKVFEDGTFKKEFSQNFPLN